MAGCAASSWRGPPAFDYGVKEPCFGVKIGDMQKIVKRIKKDNQLATRSGGSGSATVAGTTDDSPSTGLGTLC